MGSNLELPEHQCQDSHNQILERHFRRTFHLPPLHTHVVPLSDLFAYFPPCLLWGHCIFIPCNPLMLLVGPLVLLGCFPLLLLTCHIYIQWLVSPLVKISLRMCLARSDVACVHRSLPVLWSPLFSDLPLVGHKNYPLLFFFHLQFHYTIPPVP